MALPFAAWQPIPGRSTGKKTRTIFYVDGATEQLTCCEPRSHGSPLCQDAAGSGVLVLVVAGPGSDTRHGSMWA